MSFDRRAGNRTRDSDGSVQASIVTIGLFWGEPSHGTPSLSRSVRHRFDQCTPSPQTLASSSDAAPLRDSKPAARGASQ